MAPLQLEIKLTAAVFLRQPVAPDQRRIPLPDGKERRFRSDRQILFVLK
jgi:hypothetical protein